MKRKHADRSGLCHKSIISQGFYVQLNLDQIRVQPEVEPYYQEPFKEDLRDRVKEERKLHLPQFGQRQGVTQIFLLGFFRCCNNHL